MYHKEESRKICVISLLERGIHVVVNILVFCIGQEFRQFLKDGSEVVEAGDRRSARHKLVPGFEDLLVIYTALVAWVGKELGDIVRRELILSCLFQHADRG